MLIQKHSRFLRKCVIVLAIGLIGISSTTMGAGGPQAQHADQEENWMSDYCKKIFELSPDANIHSAPIQARIHGLYHGILKFANDPRSPQFAGLLPQEQLDQAFKLQALNRAYLYALPKERNAVKDDERNMFASLPIWRCQGCTAINLLETPICTVCTMANPAIAAEERLRQQAQEDHERAAREAILRQQAEAQQLRAARRAAREAQARTFAATKTQALFRGKKARKYVTELRHERAATREAQEEARRQQTRTFAATKTQALFRGKQARKNMAPLREEAQLHRASVLYGPLFTKDLDDDIEYRDRLELQGFLKFPIGSVPSETKIRIRAALFILGFNPQADRIADLNKTDVNKAARKLAVKYSQDKNSSREAAIIFPAILGAKSLLLDIITKNDERREAAAAAATEQ